MPAIKLIEKEITTYLPQLNDKQKVAVLGMVKTLLSGQQDWWDEISAEQQIAIDKALAEVKAGKGIPHSQVMKKYQKWRMK